MHHGRNSRSRGVSAGKANEYLEQQGQSSVCSWYSPGAGMAGS